MHKTVAALVICALGGVSLPTLGEAQGRRVQEREPNGSVSQATPAAIGDTLGGALDPRCETDIFALDIPAGTRINFDVSGAAFIGMFSADSFIAWQIVDQGPPRDIPILIADRYYISISYPFHENPYGCTESTPELVYSVHVRAEPDPLGVADPPVAAFSHLDVPVGRLAAGPAGDFWGYSARWAVTHVSADGSSTVLVHTLPDRTGDTPFVLDGFGNLLISNLRVEVDRVRGSNVWRVDPKTGAVTPFTSGPIDAAPRLALAPNGDVWMGPAGRLEGEYVRHWYVWRTNPLGELVDSVEVRRDLGEYPLSSAVSPDGSFFLSGYGGVYRIVNRALQLAIPNDSEVVSSLAFDRGGYLYVVKGHANEDHRVALYDPDLHLVNDTLGHLPHGAFDYQLLFAPDRAGNRGARLLAVESLWFGGRKFVELNPAGVRAPGFAIQPLLPVNRAMGASAVVGLSYADTLRMAEAPAPVHWSIEQGVLPPGVTLSETTGQLKGVPQKDGAFTFSVRASSGDRYGFARFTITVAPLTFTARDAIDALLGGPSLSTDNAHFMDLQGNRNGQFDVGDLQAFLRARRGQP